MEITAQSLLTLPAFLAYFAVSIGALIVFAVIYTWMTPHQEFSLIRANNTAAALAFGGSLLGFVLPLASAVAHSISLFDCVVWSIVGLIAQLATFFGLRLVIGDLPRRISEGQNAAGIFVAATSIAVGIANAACMTY